MREREDLSEDVLPIAATRPAMRLGLTLELLIPLGMVGYACLMLIPGWKSILYAAVAVLPLGFVARLFLSLDYNAPRIFVLWLRTSALDFAAGLLGGASVTPLPAKRGRRVRGMRHV
jgi:type IV secretory pathway VirB3-like protein